jgi:hypothetical protein
MKIAHKTYFKCENCGRCELMKTGDPILRELCHCNDPSWVGIKII